MKIINFILSIFNSSLFLKIGVPVILLFAAFSGWFFAQPEAKKMKPFSRLERIQYVEDLYLVSYRYEEMILLGIPPKYEKKNKELDDLKKIQIKLRLKFPKDSTALAILRQTLTNTIRDQQREEVRADSLKKEIKKLKRKKRKKSEEYRLWQQAKERAILLKKSIKPQEKNIRIASKDLVNLRKSIEKLDKQIYRLSKKAADIKQLDEAEALIIAPVEISAFIDMRKARFIFGEETRQPQIDSIKNAKKNEDYIFTDEFLEESRIINRKCFSEKNGDYTYRVSEKNRELNGEQPFYQEELTIFTDQFINRDTTEELNFTPKNSFDSSLVVKTKEDLDHEIDSLEYLPRKTLHILLPEPQLSEATVDLDTTHTVSLAGNWQGSIYRNYFEVFEDLVNEIKEIKADVAEKATTTGILDEAQQQAESYMRNFVGALRKYDGYDVRISFLPASEINKIVINTQKED